MTRIGVVTVGRSDYGIYVPILRKLTADPAVDLKLIVAAAHLSSKFGSTIGEIENDGFAISARVPMLLEDDKPGSVSACLGRGVSEFSAAYSDLLPDIILLLGDRYEMFAAAIAALPMNIPIAHLHGGELTFGAIDDSIRHSITKLSHVHFAATQVYAKRIRQMGEEPWRVHVTGSPAIDTLEALKAVSESELQAYIGLPPMCSLLITYHPVTVHSSDKREDITPLLAALDQVSHNLIFTFPNADPGNSEIIKKIREYVVQTPRARLFTNLGHQRYLSLQKYVAAMVGNSSSGITEAASFKLPVVNIGSRQAGRMRTPNIIDVNCDTSEILDAIKRATSLEFRDSLLSLKSPYGDGHAAERIVSLLKTIPLNSAVLFKRFVDIP